ncbi:MAG TPA: SLC13 family permease [Bacteroidales bacterium]|nr:SLC13 family permease [Bacteroidales bacterium]
MEENKLPKAVYDPLDMHQYRIDKLPRREKSKFERWLAILGPPVALLAFIILGFFTQLPFLTDIDPARIISEEAREAFQTLGSEAFSRSNHLMLAIFAASILLWLTNAIPNYLTSLIVIISIILCKVVPEKEALAQLGHPVMWLNIMSFVLASMLVTTGLAKRFALWFLLKFGKSAGSVFLSFLAINTILSACISSTTGKAAIMLPIFMVISAIYGARPGEGKRNFGRSLVLQNLLQINLGAGVYMTGSGANLLAVAIIGGAIGGKIFYGDWLMAMFPVMVGIMLIGYLLAMKVFFPLSPEERRPQIEGGMERLRQEYRRLGKLSTQEVKALIIFSLILGFWATDRLHGISATVVAFVGAIIALTPRIGIVKWNDVEIPWHLMLFSAGAYALGSGLSLTDLPSISVNAIFDQFGVGGHTPFWVLYVLMTGVMAFSGLIFQSTAMRAMIFVPIAIGIAGRFGYDVISLALPTAFMIEHVYVFPFNSKPAALLYETDMYSFTDTMKYGIAMMVISWLVIILAGETWFRVVGITPNGVF